MASFSNLVLMGNITRDLEQRTTPSGVKVLDVNIAVNSYRKGAENNQVATFYRGTIFGDRSDAIAKNFKRGDPIILMGRDLIAREWQDKNGQTRTSLEFTIDNFSFVGGRDSGDSSYSRNASAPKSDEQPAPKDEGVDEPIDLGDIPF